MQDVTEARDRFDRPVPRHRRTAHRRRSYLDGNYACPDRESRIRDTTVAVIIDKLLYRAAEKADGVNRFTAAKCWAGLLAIEGERCLGNAQGSTGVPTNKLSRPGPMLLLRYVLWKCWLSLVLSGLDHMICGSFELSW